MLPIRENIEANNNAEIIHRIHNVNRRNWIIHKRARVLFGYIAIVFATEYIRSMWQMYHGEYEKFSQDRRYPDKVICCIAIIALEQLARGIHQFRN